MKKHFFPQFSTSIGAPKRHQAIIRKIVASGGEMVVDEILPELTPGVYLGRRRIWSR